MNLMAVKIGLVCALEALKGWTEFILGFAPRRTKEGSGIGFIHHRSEL
jgi:hypothetical protein